MSGVVFNVWGWGHAELDRLPRVTVFCLIALGYLMLVGPPAPPLATSLSTAPGIIRRTFPPAQLLILTDAFPISANGAGFFARRFRLPFIGPGRGYVRARKREKFLA